MAGRVYFIYITIRLNGFTGTFNTTPIFTNHVYTVTVACQRSRHGHQHRQMRFGFGHKNQHISNRIYIANCWCKGMCVIASGGGEGEVTVIANQVATVKTGRFSAPGTLFKYIVILMQNGEF